MDSVNSKAKANPDTILTFVAKGLVGQCCFLSAGRLYSHLGKGEKWG